MLKELIGAGGMGLVFLAEHFGLARSVAVKVLRPHLAHEELFARRFRDEAIAASRVQYGNTVSILDFDAPADGPAFIAMEIIPGRPLGQILDHEELPIPRALGIFDQILKALDATHACAIVHADVKSDNFIVQQDAGGDLVTMIDFGLAWLNGTPPDRRLVGGTPEYMAPELVRGALPTIASDLYGAGVVLYELLTRTTPFSGRSSAEILRRQVHEAPVPPSQRRPERGIPAALEQIVLRALDKDPAARFASAEELRNAIEAFLPASSRRPRSSPRPASPSWAPRDPVEGYHFARGSSPDGVSQLELTRTIGGAIARGDVAAIANGYVALAAALAHELRLGAAICELEEGLDVVTAGQGPTGTDAPAAVDRLLASLAAVHELAGDPGKARRVLSSIDGRATVAEAA